MRRASFLVVFALLGQAGCNRIESGALPVLGEDAAPAEKERFARRLYLDLTGRPPKADETQALIARLDEEGNTAGTRGAIVSEMMATPEAHHQIFNEIVNDAYSGQSIESGYNVVCEIIRFVDPACGACEEADACKCTCEQIKGYVSERSAIGALADDFATGGETKSSDIEKALCRSGPFLFNGTSAEGVSTQVFQLLLGRPPEPDELTNARFMTIGSFVPGSPAGLLFHRYGASYEDLLDIVLGSEVYRDAMVSRVFLRYLGRQPSGDERAFFSQTLSPDRPDIRSLIASVVSSSEYFQQ